MFVTGASGHIGSLIVAELASAGHRVTGLARTEDAAAVVRARGADVCWGSLQDLDTLRAGAAEADGVIHLAFDHGRQRSGDLSGAVEADFAAIEAMGSVLTGTGKPFVGTNATGGIALAGFSGTLTEDTVLPGGPRIDAENHVIGLAQQGVRTSVVRLPPAVHGHGRYGFVSNLIDLARRHGVSGYLGEGSNRWPSTAAPDVAHLYRLALESAAAGSRLQAIAEEGIPLARIAATIAARLGVPAASIGEQDADSHFGFLRPFVGLDNPATSSMTRAALGWAPTHPGLIDTLEQDPSLTPLA